MRCNVRWRRWRITERQGGEHHGDAYLATNRKGEVALIKWVHFHEGENPVFGDGQPGSLDLASEATIPMELHKHPNIVQCHDYELVMNPDRTADLVLRTEVCEPLESILNVAPLNAWQIIRLGIDLCAAVSAMQQRGLIHGDIKRQNIFVSQNTYKLGHFGASYRITDARATACFKRQNETGSILRVLHDCLYGRPAFSMATPDCLDWRIPQDLLCGFNTPICDPALWEALRACPTRTRSTEDVARTLEQVERDMIQRNATGRTCNSVPLLSCPQNIPMD